MNFHQSSCRKCWSTDWDSECQLQLLDLFEVILWINSFLGGRVVKNLPANTGDTIGRRFILWVRKIPWRRAWHPTPVFLPGKSHGQRSLVGYRMWSYKESNMTKHTHTYTHTLKKLISRLLHLTNYFKRYTFSL